MSNERFLRAEIQNEMLEKEVEKLRQMLQKMKGHHEIQECLSPDIAA